MLMLKKHSTPIDLPKFLWALHRKLTFDYNATFQCKTQEHIPEILQVVPDKVRGCSKTADNIITSSRTTTSCGTSSYSNINKGKQCMVSLPLANAIDMSLDRLLLRL